MMEFRDLKASDIFPCVVILNKIGFKEIKTVLTPDKVQNMLKAVKQSSADRQNGQDATTILGFSIVVEVVGVILNNLPSCEQDLYKFMSNLSGVSVDEIAEMPMAEFADAVISIIQKEDFKDFFKAVSKLFN